MLHDDTKIFVFTHVNRDQWNIRRTFSNEITHYFTLNGSHLNRTGYGCTVMALYLLFVFLLLDF